MASVWVYMNMYFDLQYAANFEAGPHETEHWTKKNINN